MTEKSTSDFAARLYASLPAVYRNRDNGDLQHFLNACGDLLDLVHGTIEQRLADSFPDNPEDNGLTEQRACQSWVLPYFADLVDAPLFSPDVSGRRDEISHAVSWRQSKGTAPCIESIAESVGQMEVEIQEGLRRVAVTPRMNQAVMPARAYGYKKNLPMSIGRMAARHPALSATMVDINSCSGAVQAVSYSPGSKISRFDDELISWRQASPYGAPLNPGSYDDVSQRTVDVRKPQWNQGHAHPKQLLLYVPPPDGFYGAASSGVYWNKRDIEGSHFQQCIEEILPDENDAEPVHIFRNRTYGHANFKAVHIKGKVTLWFEHKVRFEGLQFEHTLLSETAMLELQDCSLFHVESHVHVQDRPVIKARGCLIKSFRAALGKVELEYCTVLGKGIAEHLNISDSILLQPVFKDLTPLSDGPQSGCFRYSRYHPQQLLTRAIDAADPESERVTMVQTHLCTTGDVEMFNVNFSITEKGRSCGVLHPVCSEQVRFGAEDGGEMGAFHDRRYSLLFLAVTEKLRDFIPIGMETAVIPDAHLWDKPV